MLNSGHSNECTKKRNVINSLYFSTLRNFFLSNQRTKNGDFASIILEIFLKFEAEKSKLSDFAFFFFCYPVTDVWSFSAQCLITNLRVN